MKNHDWATVDSDEKEIVENEVRQLPIKLSNVAKHLNLRVLSATLPDGISGEIRPDPSIANHYVIKVNRKDSARRQRFTVAHEIAHFLAHRDAIGDGIADDVLYRSTLSDSREAQANRIAADILMPEKLIQAWIDRCESFDVEDKLDFLANKFNVSKSAMKIRLGL